MICSVPVVELPLSWSCILATRLSCWWKLSVDRVYCKFIRTNHNAVLCFPKFMGCVDARVPHQVSPTICIFFHTVLQSCCTCAVNLLLLEPTLCWSEHISTQSDYLSFLQYLMAPFPPMRCFGDATRVVWLSCTTIVLQKNRSCLWMIHSFWKIEVRKLLNPREKNSRKDLFGNVN